MAKRKVLVDLDLNGNEIQNAVTQRVSALPGTGTAGQVVYNTGDNSFYGYDGSSWKKQAFGGDVPAAGNASPLMDGTASAGSSTAYAREDHKHPSDTSKADASALTAHTGDTTVHVTSGEKATWNAMQATSEKGAANGYAALDANTKVPIAQIPTGTGANTVPLITAEIPEGYTIVRSGTGFKALDLAGGVHYKNSVPTYADLPEDAQAGDIYTVVAAHESYPAYGEYIRTASGSWEYIGGITDLSNYVTQEYLATQLDTKQDNVSGAATTIVDADLPADTALISNSAGKVAASSVTATELGYLDGVTSGIQGQLDAKATRYAGTVSGDGSTKTWDLTHGLGGRPVVTVFDADGNEVITDLKVTATTITVTVNTALESGVQLNVVAVA